MMENMGPYGASFKEYSRIMESVPGLASHIDIGHAFLEGGMTMVRKYLDRFRKKIIHFHFTDNLGLSDDHLAIGAGIIDYFTVMELLKRMGYTGTISLEIISTRKEVKHSLDLIRAVQEEVWPL
jgi:sugar phosphate isomerase/epimerase